MDKPIILYGLATHRYLDTMMYHCDDCNSKFAGYNKKSMQLNSEQHVGYFNFYLCEKGYGVDESLHSFITQEACSESTAITHERLHSMTVDQCVNDCYKYLHAVGASKVNYCKKGATVSTYNTQQRTIDYALKPVTGTTTIRNHIVNLRDELRNLKCRLDAANALAHGDINFSDVIAMKKNNNCVDPPLKGIGESKLRQLMAAGCQSCRELLHFDPADLGGINAHAKVARWKAIARAELEKRDNEKKRLQQIYNAKEEDLLLNQVVHDGEMDPLGDGVAEDEPDGGAEADEPINTLPPLLSRMDDPLGYNARVISKYRIDNIVISEFNLRKEVQESKMMALSAEILKVDFNYKIANKIRVWRSQGVSFSPYKCITTIQNEDALNVYWKGVKHSESITELKDDLVRLRDRCNRNSNKTLLAGENITKVIYVDNCCNVSNKLKDIFSRAVLVKLDPFHWLVRWNDALLEPTSMQGGIVRQMFSRAIFNVDQAEFDRARDRLLKKNRNRDNYEIANKKILKEPNAVIPCPAILRSNVEAVMQCLFNEDAKIQATQATRNETDNTPLPKTYWKRNLRDVQDVIRRQMKHIDEGCLSDPPHVDLFKMNPLTGVIYTS